MSEIPRRLDENGRPYRRYGNTLEGLACGLLKGECLIFLGAGASLDRSRSGGPPSGGQLSKIMADACDLTWHEHVPLSTMAFYYEFYNKRRGLNLLLLDKIGDAKIEPSTTIRHLVSLVSILEARSQSPLVVTTNYDRQFEIAYSRDFHREPHVIIYNGATDPADRSARLHQGLNHPRPQYWEPGRGTHLYKLHGCISQITPQTLDLPHLVITEEDYVNFLANATNLDEHKRVLHHVRGLMSNYPILFIGYSLSDWNFRVLLKASLDDAKPPASYAVQLFQPPEPDPKLPVARAQALADAARSRWQALVDFWGNKQVDIINADAGEFMADLLGVTGQQSADGTTSR
jgi:hypothetical protein